MEHPAPTTLAPARPKVAPGPNALGLFARIWRVQDNPLAVLVADHGTFGDVVAYQRIDRLMQSFAHPDHVRHVLETHHTNYRRSVIYDKLRPVLGEGLVTADGAAWQKQRRVMQPAFARDRVASVAPVMLDEIGRLEREFQARAGQVVDVSAEMMRLTLRIAGRALFDTDVSGLAETIGSALTTALAEVDRRIDELWNWPPWLPIQRNRRFAAAVAELDRVVFGIMERRRQAGSQADDVLALLMRVRDPETGEGLSDRQLRDEVLTLLLAGHETTANWLTWTWYLLSQHPDVELRLHGELARVLSARAPRLSDLPRLAYVRQVADESLRLYPPVWGIDREAIEDDVIGGYHVPAGSIVITSQYLTHRHPEFWPEPHRFDPGRFTPEAAARRPRHAFFPFGGGPRQCIGQAFATMETTFIVAWLAQRFRFQLEPGHRVELEPGITLRPRHGMRMRVEARD